VQQSDRVGVPRRLPGDSLWKLLSPWARPPAPSSSGSRANTPSVIAAASSSASSYFNALPFALRANLSGTIDRPAAPTLTIQSLLKSSASKSRRRNKPGKPSDAVGTSCGQPLSDGVTSFDAVLGDRLGPDFAERHQAALRFIPQYKPYAPKALQKRQPAYPAQFRIVAQHAR
jgi:hypothetical protein